MNQVLSKIEYKGIFRFFEEICDIPRGSRYNKKISDYLVSFAKERRLSYVQDEAFNVIIVKEATKGYEDAPTMIIQGHMDMVCEKESDIVHDFQKEGLDLRVDGDFIYANGTTLGGDDGIAVAYALAILDDESLIHPRLEVIITTDEEIGMLGATALDTSSLRGKYMLNIDSGEEGIFLSSCAGGLTATCKLPLTFEETTGIPVFVNISGLQGGHSGTEINKNRTNASVLMGRFLNELSKELDFHLMDMKGGFKDNSIPREASAKILIEVKDSTKLLDIVATLKANYSNELKTSEPGFALEINLSKEGSQEKVITTGATHHILFMLQYAPNGLQVNSSDIEGLVESSLNLGILKIEEGMIKFCYSVRSSFTSYKIYLSEKLQNITKFLGGEYSTSGDYQAWEYKKDSKLRDILVKVYKNDYQKEPKVEAIHAGLECGVLSGKIKNLDIISLGPDMFDIHTPQERLSILSTKRVYDYLIHVLKEICEDNE